MGPGTCRYKWQLNCQNYLEIDDQHICNDIPYGINEIMSIAKKHCQQMEKYMGQYKKNMTL